MKSYSYSINTPYPNHSNYPIHILVISYHYPITHLVGCFNSSENMKVSWDHYSQYMESHKKCSKPPTSYPITHCIAWFSLQIFKPPTGPISFPLDPPGARSPNCSWMSQVRLLEVPALPYLALSK